MIGQLPNRPIGSSARARFYQWVWDRLARGQHDVYAGPGIRVTRTARGMMVEALNRGGSDEGDSRVQQYLLTDATNGDYFICRTLGVSIDTTDPEEPIVERTIGSTDIYIAKPFHLRQSPFEEVEYEVQVESWDGVTFSTAPKIFTYEYKSATYRIATNEAEETENQTIIPRFVPAVLDEEGEEITTETISPTIIYATRCSSLGVTYLDGDNNVDITLLALNDGWAWMRSTD